MLISGICYLVGSVHFMFILSLGTGFHDAAAALFDDYDAIAAVQLERLTRKKQNKGGVPSLCIDEVLRIAGITRHDVDVVVLSRASYPTRYFEYPALKRLEYGFRRWVGDEKLKDLWGEMNRRGAETAADIFNVPAFLTEERFRPDCRVVFSNHHLAHALSALFYTDWDDALIYTADGCGDNVHYSHRILQEGQLQTLFGGEEDTRRTRRIDSLGLCYAYATEALGYRPNRHEGKLTGLAAFGEPVLAADLQKRFQVDDSGKISTDFGHFAEMREFVHTLAAEQKPADVAASVQKVLEDNIFQSVSTLLDNHNVKHIGLAGGVFANVRLNRLLCEQTNTEEIFIFPGMGDEGLTFGGALEFLFDRDGAEKWLSQRRRLSNVYFGRNHNDRIDQVLSADQGITRLPGNPVEKAAQLMDDGLAGAIYEGRMEFGPRALGARSIIASPADKTINDTLNQRLQRTEFMPFAPYVLEEDAKTVFDISSANQYASRFMTITTSVHPEWHEKIPAVTHIDGTARPQIIDRQDNPLYANILTEFKRQTGLPVLINTSFNAHEEPIINTPEECQTALTTDRVDFVVTQEAVYRRTQNTV